MNAAHTMAVRCLIDVRAGVVLVRAMAVRVLKKISKAV